MATDVDASEVTVLRRWGRYGEPAPDARCVHAMVAEQAERTPDALAVSCGESVLTYRVLDARAGRLAARLRAGGVSQGQVVGVLADRSPHLVVALLAVLKCGAAYLAVEGDVPAERRERLFLDAGVTTVVSAQDAGGREDDGVAEPVLVGPDDLAYVSYTSGSTGRPKGVAVPHAAVSRLVRAPEWADFTEHDTFLQLAPVAFDASTFEIWTPLTIGARLAIYPPGRVAARDLGRVLAREGVTVLWLTAGLFHQVVLEAPEGLRGLRHLLAGGDVISPRAVRTLLARYPRLTFSNGYGPTENTTFTACWTSQAPPEGDFVPIGRAIGATRVAVLDDALRLVPPGVPGELYTGGAGLARGYVGQPAATAERFVADPAGVPGARMYRTGDLARWRTDGILEFLGRADRQVKIRGYRVEPGEAETALAACPRVRAALVAAEPDAFGGQRLAAFVLPEDELADPGALASELREELARRLPPYLVPARLIVVHQLPLNRNGKFDQGAFDNAPRAPRALEAPYTGPREPLESYLAELWAAMLGIEPVGVHDDFFEIGGHSLIAGELISHLQREFGIDLPARVFYLNPTVAELAEAVRDRR